MIRQKINQQYLALLWNVYYKSTRGCTRAPNYWCLQCMKYNGCKWCLDLNGDAFSHTVYPGRSTTQCSAAQNGLMS